MEAPPLPSEVISSSTETSVTTTAQTNSSTSLSSIPALGPPTSSEPSATICSNVPDPSSNVRTESIPVVTVASDEAYRNVRFVKIAGTRVLLWLFPEGFGQFDACTNIYNASTLTSLLLGHIWLTTKVDFPEDGPLHQSWFSSILYAATTGVKLSNESADGVRTLELEEAASYLCKSRLVSIVLGKPVTVRLADTNPSLRLAHHLEEMAGMKTALFIYDKKAVLFLSRNGSLIVIDNHRNGSVGAVVVKGYICELAHFLRSLESTLGLDENCYGTFVNFS